MSCQIFTSILCPSLKNIREDLPKSDLLFRKSKKKSCVLCRNFMLKVSLTILSADDDKIRIPARACHIFYIYLFSSMTSIIFLFILVDLSVIVIYLACYLCIYLLIYYLRINYQRATSRIIKTYYKIHVLSKSQCLVDDNRGL